MLLSTQFSMLIVVVDLDCHKCYHKIRKILCELQYHERIQTISFDDKSKTITIVGPFDPLRLACMLRCKGGKVVKDVHIVDNGGCKSPPQNGSGKPEADNGGSGKPEADNGGCKSPPQNKPGADNGKHKQPKIVCDSHGGDPRQKLPCSGHPGSPPACRDRLPVEYVIPTVEIPSLGPCWCPCCAPCYQGYYERCRCCCGGRVYGATVQPLLAPCGYTGCRTFSYDDPSAACSIM